MPLQLVPRRVLDVLVAQECPVRVGGGPGDVGAGVVAADETVDAVRRWLAGWVDAEQDGAPLRAAAADLVGRERRRCPARPQDVRVGLESSPPKLGALLSALDAALSS